MLGLTSAAASLPILLFTLLAGALADHADQRRMLIASQLLAAVFTGILALLTSFGGIQFWHVVAIAFLVGALRPLRRRPTRRSCPRSCRDARSATRSR